MFRREGIAVEDDFLTLSDRKTFIISMVMVLGVLCNSWNVV